jgi:hypothetical protein
VIWLSLKYDTNGEPNGRSQYTQTNAAMDNALSEAAGTSYKGLTLLLLPPLEPIPRREVESFISHRRVQMFCDSDRSLEWIADVGSLYRQSAHIPMMKLIPHLEEMLQRYAR